LFQVAGQGYNALQDEHPMRSRSWFFAFIFSAVSIPAVLSGCATLAQDGGQTALLRAKDRVAPALVHIRPVKSVYTRGKREELLTIGSGFILTADGFIVTNEHVAGDSRFVRCVLSTREEVDARVVGVDRYTDIAVLKVKLPHPLPHVRLGSSASLESGQSVLALGSPHGLARSVSRGIISVTNRHLNDSGLRASLFNNWIQTDAAINPGNSGGPLVNLDGEVIGINARVLRGAENVGFAIPIDVAKEVIPQLIENGRVIRAWLGLDFQEMLARTDDPDQQGVVVAGVDPLSPAQEAGVLPGDILTAVNGVPVHARFEEELPTVRKRIAELPIGEAATLTLQRANEELEISAVTEELGALRGQELEFPEWGFTATEVTPSIARQAQLPDRQGAWVSGSQPGTPAAMAGLKEGDIILQVDEAPVASLAEFERLYQEKLENGAEHVLLFVKRGALTRFVLVEPIPAQVPALPETLVLPEGSE
jgi:serine protease Do